MSRWLSKEYTLDGVLFGCDAIQDSFLAGLAGLKAVYFVDVKFVVAQEYFLLCAEQLVVHYYKVGGVAACLEIYDRIDDVLSAFL